MHNFKSSPLGHIPTKQKNIKIVGKVKITDLAKKCKSYIIK